MPKKRSIEVHELSDLGFVKKKKKYNIYEVSEWNF